MPKDVEKPPSLASAIQISEETDNSQINRERRRSSKVELPKEYEENRLKQKPTFGNAANPNPIPQGLERKREDNRELQGTSLLT